MTVPPVKATFKAVDRLVLAAFVVRIFAFVATFIPKNPANPEANAPTINDMAINALESLRPAFANPSNNATAITKIVNTRYSALRKAIAPSAILAPICFILSVPSSCLLIQVVFQNENSMASIPAPIMSDPNGIIDLIFP